MYIYIYLSIYLYIYIYTQTNVMDIDKQTSILLPTQTTAFPFCRICNSLFPVFIFTFM